jgi:hypothetical protein
MNKKTIDRYKSILDSLMSFIDGLGNGDAYGREKNYTQEELSCITPDNIVQWMNLPYFGTTDPALDANPSLAKSNTIQFYKKGISFSMPNYLELLKDGWKPNKKLRS